MKNVVKKQHGFTLLELVVVVAVLGLITSLATEFVVDGSNQQRYDNTRQKVVKIRQAIIGQPDLSQNGEVQVSGFIADTGVVPQHFIALLMESYCDNPMYLRDESACNAAGNSWIENTGWRGPYLVDYTLVEGTFTKGTAAEGDDIKVTYPVYRDGWGNTAAAWVVGTSSDDERLKEDILYSGWRYVINASTGDISIVSAGLDGRPNPGDYTATPVTADAAAKAVYETLSSYERDYPVALYSGLSEPFDIEHMVLVPYHAYQIGTSTLNLEIHNAGSNTSNALCVGVQRANGMVEAQSALSIVLPSGGTSTATVNLSSQNIGNFYIGVYNDALADCALSVANQANLLEPSNSMPKPQKVLSAKASSPVEATYTVEFN